MSVPRLSVLVLAISISLTSCGFLSSPEVAPPTAKSPVVPTPAGLESFYNQEVVWRNCGDADCATIIVPVDYADPKGPTTKLAITKVKANGESIGSLFVNPGGPGGSAFDYAKAADYIVSPDIRDNYDIVGVDPRGVVHSSPITCLTDQQRDEILEVDGLHGPGAAASPSAIRRYRVGAGHAGLMRPPWGGLRGDRWRM
jgi:pimeloyl-ACP methyl ester carboxylesterase